MESNKTIIYFTFNYNFVVKFTGPPKKILLNPRLTRCCHLKENTSCIVHEHTQRSKNKKSHQEMCVYSLSLPKTAYQSYCVTGQNNLVLPYLKGNTLCINIVLTMFLVLINII